MIANHGQSERYYHSVIGVNSRLDTIQAAILNIKLEHLDEYARRGGSAAQFYDDAFRAIEELQTPVRAETLDARFSSIYFAGEKRRTRRIAETFGGKRRAFNDLLSGSALSPKSV
jgi:dTDP-4-amino-4,6-dideoxygalactose transaminase